MFAKYKNMDMLHGSLWDKLVVFSLPLAFTSILQQLYNAADIFFLGHYVSGSAMAAVGNNIPMICIVIMLFVGLSLGANVVMARYLGQGRPEEANRTMYTGIWVALISGVSIMILGFLTAEWATRMMDVPEEVFDESVLYMRWYFAAMPFIALFNFESAFFRALGKTSIPMVALMISCSVNIVGNYIAVGIFDTGINGVAFATLLAFATSAGYLWVQLMRQEGVLHLKLSDLRIFEPQKARAMVSIGLPAGIQGMVFGVANIVVQVSINSLGPDVMAGSAAAFTIENNCYCFVNAFGLAATTFVGQCYGARDFARCTRISRVAMGWNVGVTLFLGIGGYFISPWLLSFFTDKQEVIDVGMWRIIYILVPQFINSVVESLSGVLRGYGWSLPPAIISMTCICGERFLWIIFVFPLAPSYETLMITYPISWALTAAIIFVAYVHCTRRIKRELMAA